MGTTKNQLEPVMYTVPPIEQYRTNYKFSIPVLHQYNEYTHYIFITSYVNETDKISVNGLEKHSYNWTNIPGTNMTGTRIKINAGMHFLSSTNDSVTFGAVIFGVTKGACGYAQLAGMCFSNYNNVCIYVCMYVCMYYVCILYRPISCKVSFTSRIYYNAQKSYYFDLDLFEFRIQSYIWASS